jgi:hypothetical protein
LLKFVLVVCHQEGVTGRLWPQWDKGSTLGSLPAVERERAGQCRRVRGRIGGDHGF